jgi:transposase
MKKQVRYSPEVRERAVRLLYEHQGEYESQWAALESIASKIGCTAETLRKWVRQSETDQGIRAGMSTSDRERLKQLERENRELKQANEILRKASAYFAKGRWTADRSDGDICRSTQGAVRGRADLQANSDCPVELL